MLKVYRVKFEGGKEGIYRAYSSSMAAFKASQDGIVKSVSRISSLYIAVKITTLAVVLGAFAIKLYTMYLS